MMRRALLFCGIISPLLYAAASLGRSFAVYTLATVAVMVLFGGWSAMDIPAVEAGLPTPWVGVKERIYWYSYQLWFIVLAVKLLQAANGGRDTARQPG